MATYVIFEDLASYGIIPLLVVVLGSAAVVSRKGLGYAKTFLWRFKWLYQLAVILGMYNIAILFCLGETSGTDAASVYPLIVISVPHLLILPIGIISAILARSLKVWVTMNVIIVAIYIVWLLYFG